MTEASAVLTVLGPEEHRAGGALLRSAGRPVPGVALTSRTPRASRSRRARPARCAPGPATSCASTGSNPDATAEAFADGWYHTGDAGYLDDQGYLFLVDRVKDMIVTGGENVYSSEVENAIATHDAVAQVAVIGIPDAKWGEAVHAIVVLNEGSTATEDEITRLRQGVDRRVQGPQVDRVPRRAAAAVGRHEGAQARAAPALLGRRGPRRRLTARREDHSPNFRSQPPDRGPTAEIWRWGRTLRGDELARRGAHEVEEVVAVEALADRRRRGRRGTPRSARWGGGRPRRGGSPTRRGRRRARTGR